MVKNMLLWFLIILCFVLKISFENILFSILSEGIEYYLKNPDEAVQIINYLKNYLFSLFKSIDAIDLYL